jgi:hypothetical protein
MGCVWDQHLQAIVFYSLSVFSCIHPLNKRRSPRNSLQCSIIFTSHHHPIGEKDVILGVFIIKQGSTFDFPFSIQSRFRDGQRTNLSVLGTSKSIKKGG